MKTSAKYFGVAVGS